MLTATMVPVLRLGAAAGIGIGSTTVGGASTGGGVGGGAGRAGTVTCRVSDGAIGGGAVEVTTVGGAAGAIVRPPLVRSVFIVASGSNVAGAATAGGSSGSVSSIALSASENSRAVAKRLLRSRSSARASTFCSAGVPVIRSRSGEVA